MEKILGAFLLAFALTFAATPIVIKLAVGFGAIDLPSERKVHESPVPRMGGLAIFFGFICSIMFFVPNSPLLVGLLAGSSFIVLIGVIDDKYSIPAKWKLFGQIIAAMIFTLFSPGNTITFVTNPITGTMSTLGVYAVPLTIIWIVGITNAVNLIDGLDGLAAGISFISAVVLMFFAREQVYGAIAIVLAASIAGSCLGFLQFNFYPAKVFMGDTGSLFLGFVLAAISVQGTMKSAATIALLVPLLALILPIFDTGMAIVRRLITRKPLFKPDKEHLHHRLMAVGLSHKQTVLVMYLISALVGIFALTLARTNGIIAYIMSGLIVLVLCWLMQRLGIIVLSRDKEANGGGSK